MTWSCGGGEGGEVGSGAGEGEVARILMGLLINVGRPQSILPVSPLPAGAKFRPTRDAAKDIEPLRHTK